MHVEGQWTFTRQSTETIWNMLTEPALLIQIMPDIRHLTEVKPGHFRMSLSLPPAVFGIEEVLVEAQLNNVRDKQSYEIQWQVTAGKLDRVSGTGRIELVETEGNSSVIYQFNGEAEGQLASLGTPMLETQMRANMRRLFTRMDKYLRGVPLTVHNQPTTSSTLVEAWVVLVGGVVALIFLGLFIRLIQRWSRSRKRS